MAAEEDAILFDKVCADILEEFGLDMKAEIEATSNGRPLRDKAATARLLRDEVAPRWREQRKQFRETGIWSIEDHF